ncbi:MAG TPA: inositol monophosphatase [Thermotoga sp.]|nr:inositol monophosphatase [Thermotoga sp.]
MDRLDFAIKLLRKVGYFLLQNWGNVDKVFTKSSFKDLVTDVDKESQKIIVENIRKNFPDEHIISEEGISEKGNKVWIIDPIDGTVNFVHGLPSFSISLAYVEKHKIIFGVVHVPVTGETFYAIKGKGAYMNGERISVSERKNLKECVGSTGNYPEFTGKLILGLDNKVRRIRILGSAAASAAYVGAGKFDFFVAKRINLWDVAASILIVRESGGKVTDFNGNEANINSRSFVFSNSFIHDEVLDIVKKIEKH